MKTFLTLLFTVLLNINIDAQDIASFIKEGDRWEVLMNEKAAFEKFKEVLRIQPVNIYALNKCSELCSRIGKRETDVTKRANYYSAAKTYAGIALKINPNNSEANCVMAIALGRTSMDKSGKEKISTAKEIKKHVDAAIKNDPMNFKAWHVLGRWNYELSTLNMLERGAVKILFGGLPKASLTESIMAFEKSKSLAAGFILNYFEMARAYKKNDQRDKAIGTLTAMLLLPNQTEDDETIKTDGRKLLKQWQ